MNQINIIRHLLLVAACSFSVATAATATIETEVKLDRSVLPADKTDTAVIKITLKPGTLPEPDARQPLNLALVIDKSGSMAGEKLSQTRRAARQIVERLGEKDSLAIVAYDSEVHTLVEARRVDRPGPFLEAINGIQAGGSTALYGGVERGARLLKALREEVDRKAYDRIILLSDGLANRGPSQPSAFASLGDTLANQGIVISTIGVGLDYSEDIMTTLALSSQGNTYFVANASRIPAILDEELRDATSVVASNLEIQVNTGKGIQPVRILGPTGTIQDRQVTIPVRHLYSGAQRYVLVEVEVAPRPAGQQAELGTVRINYLDNAGTERRASGTIAAEFSANEENIKASASDEVLVAVARHLRVEAQAEAVRASDAGKRAKARRVMESAARSISGLASRQQEPAPALAEEAGQARANADQFKAGLDARSRKAIVTENAELKNQQRVKTSGSSSN